MKPSSPVVVALGEILWDMFPSGPRFGGAPANFAHHAASLGAEVSIVSSVGDDDLGKSALQNLQESNLNAKFVDVNREHPTGTVSVDVDDKGHASYRFHPEEAWDHIPWSDELKTLAASADAACFGTLGQRHAVSRKTIRSFVEAMNPSALRVLDLNLREPFYDDAIIEDSLQLANVLKINDDELKLLAQRYCKAADEVGQAKELGEQFSLRAVAVTRGTRGGLIIRGDEVSAVPSMPTEVRDTVGAGDSYTAAMTVGLLRDIPLDTLNRAACRIAEYVCTQPGATPALPLQVITAI